MKKTAILVLGDAGKAGRELLLRWDVKLAWALTVDEAKASISSKLPRMVLTRNEYSAELLGHVSSLEHKVPIVVLLEEHEWGLREKLFSMGATALVSASSVARVMEAVCALTGLRSQYVPRVPYREVVDVTYLGNKFYVQSAELGVSGICLVDFPPARVGDRVDIELVMMDRPVLLTALVSNKYPDMCGVLTEFVFNSLDESQREFLEQYVSFVSSKLEPMPEPVGLNLERGQTGELSLSVDISNWDNNEWIELLKNSLDEPVDLPSWLSHVKNSLTELEMAALYELNPAIFVMSSLQMRVDLAKAMYEQTDQQTMKDICEVALNFCEALVFETVGIGPKELAQIPDIRAGILSQVYGSSYAIEGKQAA